jgi:phosphohistidine swiveling domain-containing protein
MIMTDTMKYIQALDGTAGDDRRRLGGKAASLNALVRAGTPVPAAICLTADAYRALIAQLELRGDGASADAAELRARIEATPVPDDLRSEIVTAYAALGRGRIAVRSSAIGEDSAASSFAGQYVTFLNVEGDDAVVASVKSCWASLSTAQVEAYGNRSQDMFRPFAGDNAIAVVLQRMLDADAAGVLFTADPIGGSSDRIVIESAWGLGEGVVSSQVVTDSYLVEATTLAVTKTIRHKPLRTVCRVDGGAAIENTPPAMAAAATLTDDQARALARCALTIRHACIPAFEGKELDIEWAIKDGEIAILQARPITVSDPRAASVVYADADEMDPLIRDNAMFSRMDTGEIVTGLMTPLGLSFCRFYQNNIHGPAVKTMGLRKLSPPQHFMGYIRGYVYLNISASAYMLTQCPPTRDDMKFTKRYATDEVDLANYRNPYGDPVKGLTYLRSSLHWLGQQIVNLATANKTARRMEKHRQERMDRFLTLDPTAMSLAELDAEFALVDKSFLMGCAAYMPFFLQSFALYDALAELCEKWLSGRGNGLQNRIKASLNNLRTIEVTKGVVALADDVRNLPELRDLFLDAPAGELIERLQQVPSGKQFWNGPFAEFLRQFGARGRQEFELSIPRWNDDPLYLLNVIRLYLRNEFDLHERMRESDALRGKETERLLATLPMKARLQLRFVISAYSKMADLRERVRPVFIAETWFYRRLVLEVLRRVSELGVTRIADLPFIDFNELRDYVAGRKTAEQAFSRELVERNRREHLINLRAEEPPMSIIGGYKPTRSNAAAQPTGDSDTLTGLAASPGVVVARARVITDVQRQAEEFQQGEILVAKFTDASWTPLFILAAGIVADVGSPLSHSSIVSREFGIPAVVNTRSATQAIRTGDFLYLDGDAGIVRIEERANRQIAA